MVLVRCGRCLDCKNKSNTIFYMSKFQLFRKTSSRHYFRLNPSQIKQPEDAYLTDHFRIKVLLSFFKNDSTRLFSLFDCTKIASGSNVKKYSQNFNFKIIFFKVVFKLLTFYEIFKLLSKLCVIILTRGVHIIRETEFRGH